MPGESLPLARQRSCRRPSALVVVALVLVAALTAAPARAQESRGSITGRVADSSGGVLPGATVTVVNTATNGTTTIVTNDTGVYTALYLIPGEYTVTATLSGFKSVKQGEIRVRVGDRVVIDITLAPGAVEESIVVTARPVLETGTATMGQVNPLRRNLIA